MQGSVIVVGVDGSEASKEALRWAAGEAEAKGARVRVVMASTPLNPDAWIPHVRPVPESLASTRRALQRLVGQVLGDAPVVDVEQVADEGPPVAALLRQAEEADLLVLGSRGRGGFASLLLGSVSLQCATHAPCTVVIVRPPRRT